MRRAMPYPCNGPSACKVLRTINANVPCQTSALSPMVFSPAPMGCPYLDATVPMGMQYKKRKTPAFCFRILDFFRPAIRRVTRCLALWLVGLQIAGGLVERRAWGG